MLRNELLTQRSEVTEPAHVALTGNKFLDRNLNRAKRKSIA